MPAINISNIKDAKLGSTQLSAVYKGSTPVWKAEPFDPDNIEITVDTPYWVRGNGRDCGDMNDWVNAFVVTHNITDSGRMIEYASKTSSDWIGWGSFAADTFTKPNEPSEMTGTVGTCTGNDSGGPSYPATGSPPVRIRFKLSDGTITDWAYSP